MLFKKKINKFYVCCLLFLKARMSYLFVYIANFTEQDIQQYSRTAHSLIRTFFHSLTRSSVTHPLSHSLTHSLMHTFFYPYAHLSLLSRYLTKQVLQLLSPPFYHFPIRENLVSFFASRQHASFSSLLASLLSSPHPPFSAPAPTYASHCEPFFF